MKYHYKVIIQSITQSESSEGWFFPGERQWRSWGGFSSGDAIESIFVYHCSEYWVAYREKLQQEQHGDLDLDTFWGRKSYAAAFYFNWVQDGINTTVQSPVAVLTISITSFFMKFSVGMFQNAAACSCWPESCAPSMCWRCCASTASEPPKPEPHLRSLIKCNCTQANLPGLCRDSSHPHQDDTVLTLGLSQQHL